MAEIIDEMCVCVCVRAVYACCMHIYIQHIHVYTQAHTVVLKRLIL